MDEYPLNLDIAVSGDFALHVGDAVVKGKVGVPVQASGIELLIESAKLTENTAFSVTKRNEHSVIEELKERVSIDTKSGGMACCT